jgi:PAS domain S-box-containing protein
MQTTQTHPGNILIVDDTPDNLRLLSRMLADHGYKVRPAPSGSHALATTRKEAPDLILLDIMMPEMDGYEVCRTLKEDESTRDIPVIFLGGLSELEDKMKGFEAGGVDYITKPFHENEVMLRVETHLKIRSLRQSLQTEMARFKTLTEAAFEAIIIHTDGKIIDVNPEAARLLRCKETDLIGTDLMQLLPTEIRQEALSGQAAPMEVEAIARDNTRIQVEVHTKIIPAMDMQVSVTAIRDLTLQKQIESEKEHLLQENTALKMNLQDRFKFGEIIGRSPSMQMVYELISKAAASEYPVAIYGESGTGKELAAKTIHALRFSNDEPFITVNCGAVTESLFEREFFGHRKGAFTDAVRDEPGYIVAADNGTLLLDEIAEMAPAMQVKLLRFLESGEYTPVGDVIAKKANVRVITATNKDLADLVRQGKFREDLFYRIHVIAITVPPLRDRREDIRLLVEHILAKHNAQDKIAHLPTKLREMFYDYEWPGNVRELMNTIQRFLATDYVTLPGQSSLDVEQNMPTTGGLHSAIESLEKKMISEALQRTKWHRSEAAELLKMPRRSLLRKIQKYGLKPPG